MSTWWEERQARVAKAVEMVSAQADCSDREALALLRARAEETGSDLEDIATAVTSRRTSFATPAGSHPGTRRPITLHR